MFFRTHVKISAINRSSVVTLRGFDELIGVILSHSEHEIRETTCKTLNWQAAEREMIMKYCRNKPIIEFKLEQLQFYVFQDDFNLHNQLKSISGSQVGLTGHTSTF